MTSLITEGCIQSDTPPCRRNTSVLRKQTRNGSTSGRSASASRTAASWNAFSTLPKKTVRTGKRYARLRTKHALPRNGWTLFSRSSVGISPSLTESGGSVSQGDVFGRLRDGKQQTVQLCQTAARQTTNRRVETGNVSITATDGHARVAVPSRRSSTNAASAAISSTVTTRPVIGWEVSDSDADAEDDSA